MNDKKRVTRQQFIGLLSKFREAAREVIQCEDVVYREQESRSEVIQAFDAERAEVKRLRELVAYLERDILNADRALQKGAGL